MGFANFWRARLQLLAEAANQVALRARLLLASLRRLLILAALVLTGLWCQLAVYQDKFLQQAAQGLEVGRLPSQHPLAATWGGRLANYVRDRLCRLLILLRGGSRRHRGLAVRVDDYFLARLGQIRDL